MTRRTIPQRRSDDPLQGGYVSIAEALTHVTSGSGKGELKRLLREAAEHSAPFGKGDIPLMSHSAGWLAWLEMHRQARSLFLRILVLEPRHFPAAAICFRYALEMVSRSTARKYGSLLVNADYAPLSS